MSKTYVVDIDGVVATIVKELDYSKARPIEENIKKFNRLYDEGNKIIYFTARGSLTGIDWSDVTKKQFNKWGVKYHELRFGKPAADYYVDDKLINVEEI